MSGGFTQAQYGSPKGLRRLSRGDLVAFYAPRTQLRGGDAIQRFIAVAEVVDDEPYQVQMAPGFHLWRRHVQFRRSAEAALAPLIECLDFVRDKSRWGYVFRRGLFEIPEADFRKIASAMALSL